MKVLITLFFSLLSFNDAVSNERELLKDYFFYRCVSEGHNSIEISNHDGSSQYAAELLSSNFQIIKSVSNYARIVVKKIDDSEYTGKRNVLLICLNTYNSDELESVLAKLLKEY